MSTLDNIVPLLRTGWNSRAGEHPVTPLPALQRDTIRQLETHWSGFMTPEMRRLLQVSCGLSDTALGGIDFTGRWYEEEPLAIFRPSLTLAIDDKGRRWIAEVGKPRGLPGPVWCIAPKPGVALFIDRTLPDFIVRLRDNMRRGTTTEWLTSVSTHARRLWAARYVRAIAAPVALARLKEVRGWIARLPPDTWVYDLRAPAIPRGLPYGIARNQNDVCRCGRLAVFALPNMTAQLQTSRADEVQAIDATASSDAEPLRERERSRHFNA